MIFAREACDRGHGTVVSRILHSCVVVVVVSNRIETKFCVVLCVLHRTLS